MLGIAVLGLAIVGLAWVASPGFMGPTTAPDPPPVALIGLGVWILGFAWMLRIYRRSRDPEPDEKNWRYRDF